MTPRAPMRGSGPLQPAQSTPPHAQPALRLIVANDATTTYDELVEAGLLAERQGDRQKARDCFHAALGQLPPERARETSALLRWIGRTYHTDGDAVTALECLDVALAIAEANEDHGAKGHAMNLQAIVHWQAGRLDEAERLYNAARDTALAAGESKLAAMTAQNLGIIANIRGDVDLALHYFETGLRDYRALGLPADVCKALNNLGLLHTGQQRWDSAATVYQEALQIAEVLGDTSSRIMIEVNYAEHFLAQGLFDRAKRVAVLASELAVRSSDDRAEGDLEKVFGIIARETGDLTAAEAHLNTAQDIAKRRDDPLLLGEATRAKADVHRRQGRNRETLQCLNVSHRIFSQLKARREIADVDSRITSLESEFLDVVRKWSESIESKDHYTQGHCERVADLACALAARAGLDAQSLFWFRIGAMLHDVGKLVISSEVLNKPGPLTHIEWEMVRQHPVHGVEMLKEIEFPWDVRPIVESHHERWDGKGYPHGLAGEDIPRTARILCIADVYDALTSARSYKRPLSHQEALDVMRHDVGHQFDPALFPAFEEVASELAKSRGATRAPVTRLRLEGAAVGATDELTGLPLRRAFLDRAREALETQTPVSLLVIDVDHFKLINDTYGHLAGDTVLREIAAIMRKHIRSGDFLGRYAGDEFVALLPGTTGDDALKVGESLRRAVHGITMSPDRSSSMSATISVGVACATDRETTVELLFENADRALYHAKRHGRDIVFQNGVEDEAPREPALRVEEFVGRTAERQRLTQLLDETLHSGARVVAVVGEAGIGKSSLVRQLAPEVRMRAGSLVVGRCADADVHVPLGPWSAILQAIRVLRVVAERPWRQLPLLLSDSSSASPAAEGRFALFEEVTEFLRLAAAARPLVVVIDDVQWADETSWDLLEHVLARVERDRILFCLTVRDEDTTPAVVSRRARLSRDPRVSELRLARMSREEQRDWLQQMLCCPTADSLAEHLYTHSEGNPFFCVQMLRSLLDDHGLRWTGSEWTWTIPEDVRLTIAVNDLLARRVNRLSPQARRMLGACAVVGRDIDVEVAVQAAIGTEDEILDAIDEGIEGSVLKVSDVHGESHIVFAHALLVEAMQAVVNPSRRKRLHQRIGAAMEELRPHDVASLAHHYAHGGVSGKAYTFACLAAERAAAVYAHDEAIALLAIAERHASSPADQATTRLRRAEIAEAAGRYADADELTRTSLELCSESLTNEQRAKARRAIVRLHSLQGAPVDVTRRRCRQLLSDAEAFGLDAERVALLMTLSQSHSRTGEAEAAERLARECVSLAEHLNDTRLSAETLMRLGSAVLQDRPTEAMLYYSRAMQRYSSIDDVIGQVRCQINIGVGNTYLGCLDAAESAYRQALARGREAHAPDVAGLAALNLGALFVKLGRPSEARACLEESHAMFRKIGNEAHRVAAVHNLAHLAREEGRNDDAIMLYREAAAVAETIGLREVVVGATAGIGLLTFDSVDKQTSDHVWESVSHDLAEIGPVWFQGRELAEAFGIRLSLARGDVERANERFESAVTLGAPHDAYGAAWLAAMYAPELADRNARARPGIREVVSECAARVDMMGSTALSARFAALMQDVRLVEDSTSKRQVNA